MKCLIQLLFGIGVLLPVTNVVVAGGMAATGAIAYGIYEAVISHGGGLSAFNPIPPVSGF